MVWATRTVRISGRPASAGSDGLRAPCESGWPNDRVSVPDKDDTPRSAPEPGSLIKPVDNREGDEFPFAAFSTSPSRWLARAGARSENTSLQRMPREELYGFWCPAACSIGRLESGRPGSNRRRPAWEAAFYH